MITLFLCLTCFGQTYQGVEPYKTTGLCVTFINVQGGREYDIILNPAIRSRYEVADADVNGTEKDQPYFNTTYRARIWLPKQGLYKLRIYLRPPTESVAP